MNYDPKRSIEQEIIWVNFADLLPDGVTINEGSATWSISPVSGPDPQASSMIIGSPLYSGSLVGQMIGGGIPGLRYAPVCIATSSDGQRRALPEYGDGHIEITL